ncbi:hypothetical protein FB451DRAFT_216883 [Mycena latifolia]|nr:hypothetical protein FB451DRAFT_216883 [Mycena latifolia]
MDSAIHLLDSFQHTRLAAVGSATILVYDHFITLDQEIDLVWRKDWSFLKCVFIFHRYLGIVCVIIELFASLSKNVSAEMYGSMFPLELIVLDASGTDAHSGFIGKCGATLWLC